MDFARNERGFCVGFAWNLILFSFVREREGYKHHADCTVCGQTRRKEPSTIQFTEHLARIFIDQNQFLFEVSYTVSQYLMT